MGEIAEMMLNGDMCECCGEWLGGEGDGIPRYCSEECAAGRGIVADNDDDYCVCSLCGKRLKSESGVLQHLRDKHGQ